MGAGRGRMAGGLSPHLGARLRVPRLRAGPRFRRGRRRGHAARPRRHGFSCLVYGRAARHTGWIGSTAATLVAFVAGLALVSRISFSLVGAFALVCATLVVAGLALPTTSPGTPGVKPPAWDVPLRMIVATSVVLILTTAATHLGPTLSGL